MVRRPSCYFNPLPSYLDIFIILTCYLDIITLAYLIFLALSQSQSLSFFYSSKLLVSTMASATNPEKSAGFVDPQTQSQSHFQSHYTRPQEFPYPYLPASLVPYGELMRVGKPTGILNIYFPYLFGALYAALISPSLPSSAQVFRINAILLLAGFLLRSLGCCWNDIIDADLDRKVSRCRLRPMAREAISPSRAYIFTLGQTAVWLCTLSFISADCVLYSIPLIGLVAFYPFAKRVTNFAQLVLGITLSYGVLVGAAAMDQDPVALVVAADAFLSPGIGLVALYWAYALWTVMHDFIYAFQDVEDDIKAGILSMAVVFQHHIATLLWGLTVLQMSLFVIVGSVVDASPVYFVFAVGANFVLMVWMIRFVNLKSPDSALFFFQRGCLLFGINTFAGLFGDYLMRRYLN
jgi:4-hydroxybenzoate polyprenyltransferase